MPCVGWRPHRYLSRPVLVLLLRHDELAQRGEVLLVLAQFDASPVFKDLADKSDHLLELFAAVEADLLCLDDILVFEHENKLQLLLVDRVEVFEVQVDVLFFYECAVNVVFYAGFRFYVHQYHIQLIEEKHLVVLRIIGQF